MENKNNSKSARRKLFFTRCGVFAILLLMLLPMLCSFVPLQAYAAEVSADDLIGSTRRLVSDPIPYETFDGVPSDPATYYSDHYIEFEPINFNTDNGVITYYGFTSFFLNSSNNVVYTVVFGDFGSGDEHLVLPSSAGDFSSFNLTVVDVLDDVVQWFYDNSTAYNPNVEPITNVWSGIMEWITGSLAAVQGVFYFDNSIVSYLDMNNSIEINGVTLYSVDLTYDGQLYYNGVLVSDESEQLLSGTVNIDTVEYTYSYLSDSPPLIAVNITTGIYANPALTVSASGGLTFLGTLAVIGVSISIAFLIIMVIQRFLRLRS